MQGGNLSMLQQQRLQQMVESKQIKEHMRTYNTAIFQCFNDCVSSFTSKDLSGDEERCTRRCVEKYMKSFQRVGLRFGELEANHLVLENQRLQAMTQPQQQQEMADKK